MDQQDQCTQANESRSRCIHEPALTREIWLVGAQLTIADDCWVKHGDDQARNFDKSPEPIANSGEAIAPSQWLTRVPFTVTSRSDLLLVTSHRTSVQL